MSHFRAPKEEKKRKRKELEHLASGGFLLRSFLKANLITVLVLVD